MRRRLFSADQAIACTPELLELLRITSIGLVLDIEAASAATAGAAGVIWVSLLAGGSTASLSEVRVALVLNDCPAEFGAEYPIGSMAFSLNGSVRSESSYG